MITVEHLTKKFGKTTAVDDLTFEVRPGVVTGFLGPNGSGKSTTMRVILGLDRPSAGRALIDGRRYSDFRSPLREVGALLDAKAAHPGRSARNHLVSLALSNGIPLSRVDEVLEKTGLIGVANKRVGTFSLGMGQRLGIAAALLGDAPVLMFDEPVNGLDPEGIKWVRDFFRSLAREGRTIFVSSHLMSEMAQTADELVVIGRGRLIAAGSIEDLTSRVGQEVLVHTTDDARLAGALAEIGLTTQTETDGLVVHDVSAERVGDIAFANGLAVHQLVDRRASLEETFMTLTGEAVEFHGNLEGIS